MPDWAEWRMPLGELAQLKFAVVPVALAPFTSSDGAIEWACENGVVGTMDDAATGGKGAAIDKLVGEKEALIADLEAYKKSLIFETVTGKREVA